MSKMIGFLVLVGLWPLLAYVKIWIYLDVQSALMLIAFVALSLVIYGFSPINLIKGVATRQPDSIPGLKIAYRSCYIAIAAYFCYLPIAMFHYNDSLHLTVGQVNLLLAFLIYAGGLAELIVRPAIYHVEQN